MCASSSTLTGSPCSVARMAAAKHTGEIYPRAEVDEDHA
jgi:hypothetical protein